MAGRKKDYPTGRRGVLLDRKEGRELMAFFGFISHRIGSLPQVIPL
jgi:hypothetical protein